MADVNDSRSAIFRKRALQGTTSDWVGELTLTSNPKFYTLLALVTLLAVVVVIFVLTYNYSSNIRSVGIVQSTTGLVQIRSPEAGYLDRLYVSQGEMVTRGQILAELSGLAAMPSGEFEAQRTFLFRKIAITKNEIQNVDKNSASELLLEEITNARLKAETRSIEDKIAIQSRLIDSYKSKLTEELKLLSKSYISQYEITNTENNLYSSELQKLISEEELASKNAELQSSSAKENLLYIKSQREKDVLNKQLINLEVELEKLELAQTRSLVSPTDGKVIAVVPKEKTSIFATDSLITILPAKSELNIRSFVPSGEIGQIRLENQVKIRFDDFPHSKYGVFDGRVVHISNYTSKVPDDLFNSQLGALPSIAYVVDIELASDTFTRLGGAAILPGMGAQLTIVQGEERVYRRIFSFIKTRLAN